MIVYPLAPSVAHRQLTDLIRPEDIGARILQGSPALSAAVDFHENGMMAGIFESTRGKLEVRFPFTEHATIIEGEVIIPTKPACARFMDPATASSSGRVRS